MKIWQNLVSALAIQASFGIQIGKKLEDRVSESAKGPFESLTRFAEISHTLNSDKGDVCFARDRLLQYFWAPTCQNMYQLDDTKSEDTEIQCEGVFQSGDGSDANVRLFKPDKSFSFFSKQDECDLLEQSIIYSHVDLSLQGKLDERSAYGPHHVVVCNEEQCSAPCDLQDMNKFSSSTREYFNKKEKMICPFADSKETDISPINPQNLSATVFGSVPKQIENICLSLLRTFAMASIIQRAMGSIKIDTV